MTQFKNNMTISRELQALMHEHGSEAFTLALAYAYHSAADDTEDFDDKSLTQKYRYLANGVDNLMDEEPEFSKSELEEGN